MKKMLTVKNCFFSVGFEVNCETVKTVHQCFSTGVPRNPRVPRASTKGSAAGQ